MTKGAVNEGDWKQFKAGRGGSMVVYPPKNGGELPGFVLIAMTELLPPKRIKTDG